MASSISRSSSVPLSFDRFRVRSLRLRSPFRNCKLEKRSKASLERSRSRKTQVHPQHSQSTESPPIVQDASYLFRANGSTKMTTSSPALIENSNVKKEKKSTVQKNVFNTQPTSNVNGALDCKNLSLINPSYTKLSDSTPDNECPPTPCMVRYRQCSVQNVITTHVLRRPQSLDFLNKRHDNDRIDQYNA